MSEYKRFISYIYRYKNDEKLDNAGFARIEVRNSECKFTVNVKLLNSQAGDFDVYIIKRDDKSFELLKLGQSRTQNNLINIRYYTEENNILNTGYNLNLISGIILYKDDDSYYGTQWDSKPILLKDIKLALLNLEKEDVLIEESKVEIEESIVEEEKIIEEKAAQEEKIIEEVKIAKDDIGKEIGRREEAEQEAIEEISVRAAATDLRGEINSNLNTELLDYKGNINSAGNEKRDPDYIEAIFKNKESVKIFEDKNVCACVKINPSEIEKLPKEFWGIMNNSFLIHGYYNFKHIICAIVKDNNSRRYILGVPGKYENRESFMAKMFGFEYFKSIKSGKVQIGDFGYWIIYIKTE